MKDVSVMTKSGDRARRAAGGFTLIELLVVIAIIALLISVLLPALGKAREVSRQLVCASKVRSMVQGQLMYAGGFKDYIAGSNTSGAFGEYQKANGTNPYQFDTTSTTPTSTHDWISPTLGDQLGLSANRARRSWDILNKHGCPSVRAKTEVWGGGDGDDLTQFSVVSQNLGWKLTSYLSPASFHYRRLTAPNSISQYRPAGATGNAASLKYLNNNPATLPMNYVPRLDRVGTQLASKVLVADGTRFCNTGLPEFSAFDFDPSPAPSVFGNFMSSGPIFRDANEYGRTLPGANGLNIRASYRHGSGSINCGFFDGHAASRTKEMTWENAEEWYPSGSDWNGNNATDEAAAKYTYLLSHAVGERGLP